MSTGVDSGEPPASPFPTVHPRTQQPAPTERPEDGPAAPPPPRHRPAPPPPHPATRLTGLPAQAPPESPEEETQPMPRIAASDPPPSPRRPGPPPPDPSTRLSGAPEPAPPARAPGAAPDGEPVPPADPPPGRRGGTAPSGDAAPQSRSGVTDGEPARPARPPAPPRPAAPPVPPARTAPDAAAPVPPRVPPAGPDTSLPADPPTAPPPPTHAPHPVGVSPVPTVAPPPVAVPLKVRRTPAVRGAVAVCVVLGLGLIGGATAGAVLDRGPEEAPAASPGSPAEFAQARAVWHTAPVDRLFPPTIAGPDAGPGGSDRTWTRIGIAEPSGCTGAFDPLLDRVLAPTGCTKLLRATYVDSTSTTVTTVGILVTAGDAAGMHALGKRWTDEHLGDRIDLIPRPVAFPGTAAARFGPKQRGSWDVRVSADQPFVVYAVSGFADGRTVATPQPPSLANAAHATSAPAQAGLGFDATGLAKAVDTRLSAAVEAELHPDTKQTQGTSRTEKPR